jgi:hypothetical protein
MIVSLLFFAAPALLLSAVVIFLGRKRAQWQRLDFLLLVLPFVVRAFLDLLVEKGEWNLPEEAFLLGALTPIAFTVRVITSSWRPRLVTLGLLAALSLTAFGLWLGVPFQGEN